MTNPSYDCSSKSFLGEAISGYTGPGYQDGVPIDTGMMARELAQGRELPGDVQREFEGYLQYGRLECGILRVRCESWHAKHRVAFSCKRRGFCPGCGSLRRA